MKIKKAIYTKLSQSHGVTSLLGTNSLTGDKDLYLESLAPESANYPRVTMQITGRERVRHMTGSTGLVDGRVGFVVSAQSVLDADAVADAIRIVLDSYQASTIGAGDDTVTVSTIYVDSDFDNTLMPTTGSGTPIYQRIMEYVVWYRESLT
jgi:hypothetical protein